MNMQYWPIDPLPVLTLTDWNEARVRRGVVLVFDHKTAEARTIRHPKLNKWAA